MKKDKEDWVREMHVYRGRLGEARTKKGGQGRPDWEVFRYDMKELGLASVEAMDRHAWKRKILEDMC